MEDIKKIIAKIWDSFGWAFWVAGFMLAVWGLVKLWDFVNTH